jgi:Putative restriction endonuclease
MATVIEEPVRTKQAPAAVVCAGRSVTMVDERMQVSVPSWVVDLDSFRRWVESDDVPEKLHVWYLKGEVWIDMSKQQLFSHLAIKNEFGYVLTGLIKTGRLGMLFPDGAFLANIVADIGGNPDATFISHAALDAKRVRLVEGKKGGYVEVEGSPDMVLEVVSASSVRKDTVVLRQAYWEAGALEYWLVDARKEPLTFDILRHSVQGYKPTRKPDGWLKSAVFGKSFRLTHQLDKRGLPEFTLETR